MVTGLTGGEGLPPPFPAPSVSPQNLGVALSAFTNARDAAMTADAQAKQATELKNGALTQLVTFMKTDLHYAEDAVNGDDALLSLLGWGGRRPQDRELRQDAGRGTAGGQGYRARRQRCLAFRMARDASRRLCRSAGRA